MKSLTFPVAKHDCESWMFRKSDESVYYNFGGRIRLRGYLELSKKGMSFTKSRNRKNTDETKSSLDGSVSMVIYLGGNMKDLLKSMIHYGGR
jgi:uncharacterized ParB-like nuclease family protein